MVEIRNLSVAFNGEKVVKDFNIHINYGEMVGIVGESGSGKTQTALAINGLSSRNAEIGGNIFFEGVDLLGLSRNELRSLRGEEIAMIFQEPMTSLNPTMKIGRQVEEALRLHTNLSKEEMKKKAIEALRDVELSDPEGVYNKYPHELSGGMKQRVMIASAIIASPKLLIADEPTTALDVSVQAQILKLLVKLNKEHDMAVLFISHDLRIVKKLCGKVVVMKRGEVVEAGDTEEIFYHPKNDYTKSLIAAIPRRPLRREAFS